ncbi:MAG: NAD(P)-dependent oxidoreductase, partial [Pirellulaceae bacterium]|nr:NAD(P)-dependent oxidoreductase [Pirellulaceae bacterium]
MSQTSTAQERRSTTFRILAAEEVAQQGLDFIRSQADADVHLKVGLSEDELARTVGGYDGMIVRSSVQVTSKVLSEPGRLKAIARAGVGVDNIDLDAATAAGILVLNTAEASTITTAEHSFALILALARHIGPAHQSMSDGQWKRSAFAGRQLAGKKLGIIGLGRIGRAIAQRAMAFDMSVVAYDPFINASTMMDGTVKMVGQFTQLLAEVDVLTFHVPLSDQTS